MNSLVGVEHGTRDGYGNHGCRCDACTAAYAAYVRGRYTRPCVDCGALVWVHDRRARSVVEEHGGRCRSCWLRATGQLVHGTTGGYRRGCRCDECRRASAEARARHRRRPNVKVHGANGYSNGCRCDICREGQMAKSWRYGADAVARRRAAA